jgi:CTP synthase
MKYVVITGGVISGLGKGITASSVGLLLKSTGLNVTAIKIDPYLNIDAGTMSPYEHGETYVLDDAGETDLDMGNYERFLDINLTKNHNITTGKIYSSVITKERNGEYLGKTVQIIPHITDEIQQWIRRTSCIPVNKETPDVCIIEVGGTVGDIEVSPFIEALRVMQLDPTDKFCFVHVSLVIDNGELKTKPTQDSVAKLRSLGITPDLLVLRTPIMLTDDTVNKLTTFCHINKECIISNTDVKNIYYVPDTFKKQNICDPIAAKLGLTINDYDLSEYYKIIEYYDTKHTNKRVVGIAGKYTGSPDTYLSLIRAIEHAAFYTNTEIQTRWLNTEHIDETELKGCDCLIIPGGFGSRGIQGKLDVARYAREQKVPTLGICLGLQVMVIDCWNALNNYNDEQKGVSSEWTDLMTDTSNKIIDILPDQTGVKGGTMRLGSYLTNLLPESTVSRIYGATVINERHRHRYEVNNSYIDQIESFGLKVTGKSGVAKGELVEVVELVDHPYYIGCQYHPEYKSRYNRPHPLFIGLLQAE